jgi:hypothetical protein
MHNDGVEFRKDAFVTVYCDWAWRLMRTFVFDDRDAVKN